MWSVSEDVDDLDIVSMAIHMAAITAILLVIEVIALQLFGGAAYPTGLFNNASSWTMNPPPLAWTI